MEYKQWSNRFNFKEITTTPRISISYYAYNIVDVLQLYDIEKREIKN